jgi:hypothetical protein
MVSDHNICYAIMLVAVMFIIWREASIADYFTTQTLTSGINGETYKVARGFNDPQVAADKLSELHEFMIEFLRYLRKKFIIDGRGTLAEQQFVGRVLNRYYPGTLYENNPTNGEDTSFVINKGDKFAVCLREKGPNSGDIHEDNTLHFVVLHEMSHLGTTTIGHNTEFWTWFSFMLRQAKDSGMYVPRDYSKQPEQYCGMNITSNPYFSNL